MITDSILLEWIGLGKKIRVHLLHELCPEGRNRERERDDCLIDDGAKNKQTSETKKCEKHTSIFSKKIAATRSRRKV